MEKVSPVVLRGITTAGVNLGIVIGQLLSNAAIRGFGDRDDVWAYRGPFVIQFAFIGTSNYTHLASDLETDRII